MWLQLINRGDKQMTARELLNRFNTLDESELDLPITVVYFCDDGFVHKQDIAIVGLDPNTDQIILKLDKNTDRINLKLEPNAD
jgi:hypothetical protein